MKLGMDIIPFRIGSSYYFEFHVLSNSSIMTMLTSELEKIYWRQIMLRKVFEK
jgi:hypothetical protein